MYIRKISFTRKQKIDSTDDLGNTTTFSVSKAISVLGMDTSKIEVYYSEKNRCK